MSNGRLANFESYNNAIKQPAVNKQVGIKKLVIKGFKGNLTAKHISKLD